MNPGTPWQIPAESALIFDFDGLILDTEVPAFESWREIYEEHGGILTLDIWAHALGLSGREVDHIRATLPNAISAQLPLHHADLQVASLADMPLHDLIAHVENTRE